MGVLLLSEYVVETDSLAFALEAYFLYKFQVTEESSEYYYDSCEYTIAPVGNFALRSCTVPS